MLGVSGIANQQYGTGLREVNERIGGARDLSRHLAGAQEPLTDTDAKGWGGLMGVLSTLRERIMAGGSGGGVSVFMWASISCSNTMPIWWFVSPPGLSSERGRRLILDFSLNFSMTA